VKGQVFQLQRGSRFQQRRKSGSQRRRHSEHRMKESAKDAQLPSSQTLRHLREARPQSRLRRQTPGRQQDATLMGQHGQSVRRSRVQLSRSIRTTSVLAVAPATVNADHRIDMRPVVTVPPLQNSRVVEQLPRWNCAPGKSSPVNLPLLSAGGIAFGTVRICFCCRTSPVPSTRPRWRAALLP